VCGFEDLLQLFGELPGLPGHRPAGSEVGVQVGRRLPGKDEKAGDVIFAQRFETACGPLPEGGLTLIRRDLRPPGEKHPTRAGHPAKTPEDPGDLVGPPPPFLQAFGGVPYGSDEPLP
jgi:hypothetical protein